MSSGLNVPLGVSESLVGELQRIQDQILVLADNHEILHQRVREFPEDSPHIQRQICAVEKFILKFNEEQQPILTKIRQEIRDKGLTVKTLPGAGEEEEEVKKAGDVDEKLKSKSDVLREKMAAVRDSKKRRRRVGGGGSGGGSSQRPTRTPTPDVDGGGEGEAATGAAAEETEEERRRREEEEANGGPLVLQGQVRGHLQEVDKKVYDEPVPPVKDLPDYPFRLRNIVYKPGKIKNEKINYLRHLDLLTEVDVQRLADYRAGVRKKTIEYRNLTYIPEFNEKKQRLGYSWLSASGGGGGGDHHQMTSPPLLRNRRRVGGLDAVGIQQLVLDRPRTRRKKVPHGSRSNSNSRASTPMPPPSSREGGEEEDDDEVEEEEEEEDEEEDEEEEEEEDDDVEEEEDVVEEDPMEVDDDESKDSANLPTDAIVACGTLQDEEEESKDASSSTVAVDEAVTTGIRDMVERDELVEETVVPHAPVVQRCVDDAVVAAMPQEDVLQAPKRTHFGGDKDAPKGRGQQAPESEKVRIAKVHKAAYERQLKKILPRLEQLQEELDTKGSKFIVATRKERSRRNDMEQERAQLEEKVRQLRTDISYYDQQL